MARPASRIAAQAITDSLAWVSGLLLAAAARYDFVLTATRAESILAFGVVAAALQNGVGHRLFLYRGRYTFGSFEEVQAVSGTVAAVTLLLFAGDLLMLTRPVPASTPLVGGVIALVLMLGTRYVRRVALERATRPDSNTATRVLLFGAGEAGTQMVRRMLSDPTGKYVPVGLLDDDERKRYRRVNGIRVLGGREELFDAVAATKAQAIVLAVPSASAGLMTQIRDLAAAAGITFKVLPSLSQLLDRQVEVSDIRDVNLADLLGRGPVEIDVRSIAGYVTDRRVLVTGAGGSIGSELCRQIHRYRPAELIMLDRDESALHAVQLSLFGRAMLDDPGVLLADLRDAERVRELLAERKPQVVFHAAALKHLPLLEQYPDEAVQSNVWATISLLEAAVAHDVEAFVNISTDKAANPCSVLGYSKRITERLTAHVAARGRGRYLSVRFGNVLGSRGSVLTAFAAQIAAGGPLTVTDPDVTRYFMTVQEAARLVIQAAAIGRPGEALVLDMGRPVSIARVARQMAELAATRVPIVYTGLRPGEKRHEELFGAGERDERPLHPLVSHVPVPPLDPALARLVDIRAGREAITGQLRELCEAASEESQHPRTATHAPRCGVVSVHSPR